MRSRTIAAAVFTVVLGSAARGQNYNVDPVHSSVNFRVKHLDTSYAFGRFNDIAGKFTLDDKSPGGSSFDVTVKAASVDTGNAQRDQHLKGPDFFNAVQFPTVSFKSTRAVASLGVDGFSPQGKSEGSVQLTGFIVNGELTLHGVTKPVTIRLQKTGSGKDMRGNAIVGLVGTLVVKRSDYGMTGMAGAVGDEVWVTISLEGAQAK
jgi:polyisoprenoid-binding protein YceI